MQALLHSVPLTLQLATIDLCRRLMDTHGQVWVSLLRGHCSFLLGPGLHKVLFVPSKCLFPQSCVSSGSSIVGLITISFKWACAIPKSAVPRAPAPAPAPAAGYCYPYLCRRHWNTVLAQSLWGLWVLVHTRFVWALWASLADKGFDSKCNFAPPAIMLWLLLYPWMEGIFCWWDPIFSSQQLFSSEL